MALSRKLKIDKILETRFCGTGQNLGRRRSIDLGHLFFKKKYFLFRKPKIFFLIKKNLSFF